MSKKKNTHSKREEEQGKKVIRILTVIFVLICIVSLVAFSLS